MRGDGDSDFFSEGCRRMMFLGGTEGAVCWGFGETTPLPLFAFPAVDADFDGLLLSSDFCGEPPEPRSSVVPD